MAMNSHSIFRLAENGVKINSLICGNTLSYEMSFNDFRFQLNEELSLLFDHGNHTLRKITREKRGKIMPKVFKKHNDAKLCCGHFGQKSVSFHTIW